MNVCSSFCHFCDEVKGRTQEGGGVEKEVRDSGIRYSLFPAPASCYMNAELDGTCYSVAE